MTLGYQAIREAAAVLDLSGRGRIRATGEDRVRLLHAMSTNHIQQLGPHQGCYAFFLNSQGRILADAHILVLADSILLDTEPEIREKVYAHLDQYIIADDVTLEDVTGSMTCVGIEGPKARDVLAALDGPVPAASHETLEWENRLVSGISATGTVGYRVYLPAEDGGAFIEELGQVGAVKADAEDIRTVRLENGRPRYGDDFSDRSLPNEAQMFEALHFNKGCYLGQEIIERVRSRGQVHRLLVPLRIETGRPPISGSELTIEGANVGEITSAAYSPALGMVVALGYVRDSHARPGTQLRSGDDVATVTADKPR